MSQQGKLDPVRTIDVKFRRDAQPGSMKRNSDFILPGTDKEYAALGADGDKANPLPHIWGKKYNRSGMDAHSVSREHPCHQGLNSYRRTGKCS